jgi:hypothetical protein
MRFAGYAHEVCVVKLRLTNAIQWTPWNSVLMRSSDAKSATRMSFAPGSEAWDHVPYDNRRIATRPFMMVLASPPNTRTTK